MATAKQTKKTMKIAPDFMIDEDTLQKAIAKAPAKILDPGFDDEIQIVDISELDDPDCGLARMYYEFVMYSAPVTQELADIINDEEKLYEFQLTHEFNVDGE